ncbi:hypothetical protein C9439_02220 [archaeon SCG-AAA382B04]|nr:hypothetical protein C9439_02220 [archaeon SCG-AAA382B04]
MGVYSFLGRLKGSLARNLMILALLFAFIGGIAIATADVPQQFKVFYVTSVIGAMVMYIPGKRLVRWLYDPKLIYVLELKAEGEELALWEFFPNQFKDLTIKTHSLDQFTSAMGEIYVCRKYDPEKNEAHGTWRGSMSDIELMRYKEKIREIRGVLLRMAKEGQKVRSQLPSIVINAQNKIQAEFIEKFEKDSIYKGEKISEAIDESLREMDLQAREKREEEAEETRAIEEPGQDIFRELAKSMESSSNSSNEKGEEAETKK